MRLILLHTLLAFMEAGCTNPPASTTTVPITPLDTVPVQYHPADTAPLGQKEVDPPQPVVNNAQSDGIPVQPDQPASPRRKPQRAAPVAVDSLGATKAGFTDMASLASDIKIDIRYATTNNFTKAKIYDCPKCLLRPAAAKALLKVHTALKDKGYCGFKMFDCYRPRPYQQRLWDKVPNPDYVTPPAKGSMHSRGAAVDLTIVDKNGKELDMGTPYDFFGKEAHFDHLKLPEQVLVNRRLLRSIMESEGFEGIRTEWWHFSYRTGKFDFSDYLWKCN